MRINRITQINFKLFLQNGFLIASVRRNGNKTNGGCVSPISILEKKLESGELKADEHQKRVMNALDHLYSKIQTYQPPEPKIKSIFSTWFSTNRNKLSSSNSLKGLYIHGSVGGGKTTLMDLFYDCCQSVRFSIQLCKFIKQLKKNLKTK